MITESGRTFRLKRVFITGTAGFIGYHIAALLLEEGFAVHGFDSLNDYYDVALKKSRHEELAKFPHFSCTIGLLEDEAAFDQAIDTFAPEMIIHLAGQAGVRHSIEKPREYVQSNVIGTFNVMEAAKRLKVRHLLIASSSSVYGANSEMPFHETDKTDTQLSMYAATKKATESMAHAQAHLWNIPTTMFRFFTVYGPWGRPDLAYFKFTDAILSGKTIDIYNNGDMARDFTYVTDLVRGIRMLMDVIPDTSESPVGGDSLSPVAPYRIVNIGNSQKVQLVDFIEAIEDSLGMKANRNYLPMQPGEVQETWASADLLFRLTGYKPQTEMRDGVDAFVKWYRAFYNR